MRSTTYGGRGRARDDQQRPAKTARDEAVAVDAAATGRQQPVCPPLRWLPRRHLAALGGQPLRFGPGQLFVRWATEDVEGRAVVPSEGNITMLGWPLCPRKTPG